MIKKIFVAVFIVASMSGVAHAADCTVDTIGQSCTPTGGGTGTCVQTEIGVACSVSGAPEAVTNTQTNTQTQSTGGSGAFVPLAPIPNLTQGITANEAGLANFFNNLYKYAIGLAAMLAIIMIIWGGLEYATQDSVSKKSDGKERIYNAIFGLILVLAPALVFSIINPAILNLSINLPALDTKAGTYVPPATVLPPCGNGRRTDCTPVAATQEGSSATATAGLYCFERTNPRAANDFVCASTQAICDEDFRQQQQADNSAVSSCRKY